MRDRCKSVKPIATHFQKVHPLFQLVVSYHCQWCNGYIDPAEIPLHAHAHFENLALNKPFSPLILSINPADSSLSFSDAKSKPVVGNIDDDFIIQDSQPVPPADISIHTDDHDVANLVNTDPVVPSPTKVIVPPSYKDILLRNSSPVPDTFHSPPSPILLDPTSQVSSYSCIHSFKHSCISPCSSPHVQDVPPPQQPTTHTLLNSAPAKNLVDTPGSDISISVGGSLVLEDSQIDQTPSSTYSAPYPSAAVCHSSCLRDPTTIDDRIIKSPNPPSSDCGPISPKPDISVPSMNFPVRLFFITITPHSTSSKVHC